MRLLLTVLLFLIFNNAKEERLSRVSGHKAAVVSPNNKDDNDKDKNEKRDKPVHPLLCHKSMRYRMKCHLFGLGHPDFTCRLPFKNPRHGILQKQLGLYHCHPVINQSHLGNKQHCISNHSNFHDWFKDEDDEEEKEMDETGRTIRFGDDYDEDSLHSSSDDDDCYPGKRGNRSKRPFFTCQIHLCFIHRANTTFNITSNNEVWLYINGSLVLDVGGIHGVITSSLNMNTLNLTIGATYRFDLFIGQRSSSRSNMKIRSNLCLFRCDNECGNSTSTSQPTASPTSLTLPPSTNSPTQVPTLAAPTDSPTLAVPTESPTLAVPTESPTQEVPTVNPTVNPTENPTNTPTGEPSNSPPIQAPTLTPTEELTFSPTPQTDTPSLSPTVNPTVIPTVNPTLLPTLTPTSIATNTPTSLLPTESPTFLPGAPPPDNPTKTPTKAPTKAPTKVPTRKPTRSPTRTPTSAPSSAPTNTPTNTPTDNPTNSPTNTPTDNPTNSPTISPTNIPTETPTNTPTLLPTTTPTQPPTMIPTPVITQKCGNGVIEDTEECDNGISNNNLYGECMENCKRPVCGDGVIHLCLNDCDDIDCNNDCYSEECDDGNLIDGDGCSSQCKYEHIDC